MSKVVVASAYGGPEVLDVVDEAPPEPGDGQVRVAIHSIGVNPFDFKSYSGMFGEDGSALPLRIGSEGAGVVDAVGSGVTRFSVGDEVVGHPIDGAYAEQVVVDADNLFTKPESLGWDEAAGLLLVGTAAAHAIIAASVGDGDTILIHGAGGGVGISAVQQARALGARVIGTDRASNHERLRSLGADPVEYGEGLADRVRELAPEGLDAALDFAGTDEALAVSLELVPDRDRIATLVNFSDSAQEAGIKILGAGPGGDPGTDVRDAARQSLVDAAGNGRIKVFVSKTFSLDNAAAAHEFVRDGHADGKVVLHPQFYNGSVTSLQRFGQR